MVSGLYWNKEPLSVLLKIRNQPAEQETERKTELAVGWWVGGWVGSKSLKGF